MSLRACPVCSEHACDVKDSRPSQLGVRRRIRCRSCGHKWSTVEVSLDEEKWLRSLESALRVAIKQADDLSTRLTRLLVTTPEEPYLAPTSLGVVIRKNGYFYRPDWAGYTDNLSEAGRYDRAAAERHAEFTEGVTVHEISEFIHSVSDGVGTPTASESNPEESHPSLSSS